MTTETPSSGIAIPESVAACVESALEEEVPMILAYMNRRNQPKLSFRGSTFVYSPDQLAVWIRAPEGGLLQSLGNNPLLTMWYRNPKTKMQVLFYGRGRVEDEPELRNQIYDAIPEREQKADPGRKGKALIIDLDQIHGRTPDGPINMKSDRFEN